MIDGVERRPKLPRNAPIRPSRKRTCIEPRRYLVIESAPYAPFDCAQSEPRERPCVLLNGTCEWFQIALIGMGICPLEVLMRHLAAPNSEKRGPCRIPHCEFNGAFRLPRRFNAYNPPKCIRERARHPSIWILYMGHFLQALRITLRALRI